MLGASEVADAMSVAKRNFNCEGAQWYYAARHSDFRLFGIDRLVESLAEYSDNIRVEHAYEGALIRKGDPALTVTIEHPHSIYLGNMIEVLVYQQLWYRSTVGTLLSQCKETLEANGFMRYNVTPKIRRGCSTHEQAVAAEEVWEQILYPLSGGPPYSIANHNQILLHGEKECFAEYDHVMVDTHNMEDAIKLLHPHNTILVDSVDFINDTDWLLHNTPNPIAIIQSCDSSQDWQDLVRRYRGESRISFSLGSEVFSQVTRDTLGFTYKVCAVKREGKWQGAAKSSHGKETRAGLQTAASSE